MGFLLAPNYPYLRSYMANRQVTISNADPNITSHETLIGDIAYLSAIIERAGKKDAKAKKEAPPPETNNNINTSNWDLAEIISQFGNNCIYPNFHFMQLEAR
jgi:hypothetical protein